MDYNPSAHYDSYHEISSAPMIQKRRQEGDADDDLNWLFEMNQCETQDAVASTREVVEFLLKANASETLGRAGDEVPSLKRRRGITAATPLVGLASRPTVTEGSTTISLQALGFDDDVYGLGIAKPVTTSECIVREGDEDKELPLMVDALPSTLDSQKEGIDGETHWPWSHVGPCTLSRSRSEDIDTILALA